VQKANHRTDGRPCPPMLLLGGSWEVTLR
jgi:hypothetical protein